MCLSASLRNIVAEFLSVGRAARMSYLNYDYVTIACRDFTVASNDCTKSAFGRLQCACVTNSKTRIRLKTRLCRIDPTVESASHEKVHRSAVI